MSFVSDITKEIKTFRRGGIHPPEFKDIAKDKPIEVLPTPSLIYIPLIQHIGAPCEPLVKKGEQVRIGQMIGKSDAFVSSPIHATVSGKVKQIEMRPHPLGSRCMTIVIANDGKDEWDESVKPEGADIPLNAAKAKDYLAAIRDAGIVGLGGAAFPTHVKLSPPPDKKIDTLVLNGAECEPYLTSDYRVMLERSPELVYGIRILMIVLGVKQAIIAIEDNKPLAIETMREAVTKEAKENGNDLGEIGVAVCKTKYPQGGEKQLLSAVLNRTVPSGSLPMEIGVVVMNIGTCSAVADAVARHKPLVERVITVAGTGIPNPKNLRVRVGTPLNALLETCGYKPMAGSKVIMGGPMMGTAQGDTEVPVMKGTSGLVALSPEEVGAFGERPCLRCGRCVGVCPMGLMPSRLAAFSEHGVTEPLKELGLLDCMECGSCVFVCPAQRQLVQWIRMGKMKLRQEQQKKK